MPILFSEHSTLWVNINEKTIDYELVGVSSNSQQFTEINVEPQKSEQLSHDAPDLDDGIIMCEQFVHEFWSLIHSHNFSHRKSIWSRP